LNLQECWFLMLVKEVLEEEEEEEDVA